MSYEDQLCKWASKRYDIPLEEISGVSLNVDRYADTGCPTCGTSPEMRYDVYIFDEEEQLSHSFIIDIYYGSTNTLLQEIIEA